MQTVFQRVVMYQVKDAMTLKVATVGPDVSVEQAIQILLDKQVSGAPVVDNDGNLVGIITQFQLLEVMYDPKLKMSRVRELMTRNVLTVDENTTLATVANMLIVHRIHRLPVLRQRRVVGIISRSDLLRYFMKTGAAFETFFATLEAAQENAELASV
jgi:CBS domain-containing protein